MRGERLHDVLFLTSGIAFLLIFTLGALLIMPEEAGSSTRVGVVLEDLSKLLKGFF